jgi:putative ABC transport system permease protein
MPEGSGRKNGPRVLAITIADLRHRLRQFLIAVVGAGVVFALALLLTGMAAGFSREIARTVATTGADTWLVPEGASGPFTSSLAIAGSTVGEVAGLPGVEHADGMVNSLQTVLKPGGARERVMMVGSDALGGVRPADGRRVRTAYEAVVDRRLDLSVGDSFVLGGRTFAVVGVADGLTLYGGSPDVLVDLSAAQAVLFEGQDLVTAVAVRGVPGSVPAGLTSMGRQAVEKDSLGPMKDAVSSVDNSRLLMWVIAIIIVAALVYVSALQRTRDFAVMKAVGASTWHLFLGVAIQAVLISLAAAVFAVSTAWIFRPAYRVPVEVPTNAYLLLPVVAVVVGVLSSLVALRRAVTVDPALAFGGG